jgi:hypothetical protein
MTSSSIYHAIVDIATTERFLGDRLHSCGPEVEKLFEPSGTQSRRPIQDLQIIVAWSADSAGFCRADR